MRLLACMLCLAATGPAPAAADRRPRVTTRRVAPGVTHVRIVRRHPPNRINVLRVAVRARPAVDVVLARPDSFGFGKTSRVAERYGAVAAVNGTFSLDNGRPYSVFARNGNLEASPLMWSRAFSLSADETRLSIGHPRLEVTLEDPDSDATWTLDSVNERPWPGEMALYTPAGGRFYRPPWNACSARLRGDGGLEWEEEASGVLRTYVVGAVRCSSTRMGRYGMSVLAARRGSDQASAIESLELGQSVDVGWTVGWPQALDVMGGNPLLLAARRVVAPGRCTAYFCSRHPRTGIGITPRGDVLLVTVDGRQPRRSVGMTPVAFARVFRRLGAVSAINLDGGGSTTMVIRGRVVNRPSDRRGERRVGSAVVVHARTPPPDPVQLADEPAGPAPAVRALRADPASTGGMLDALASGELGGRPRKAPRSARAILRAFRAAHPGEP
jgi:hypothetical protein